MPTVTVEACCDAMYEAVHNIVSLAGAGFLYPSSVRPDGQIGQDEDGTWSVAGCCGDGGCRVLTGIRFCPFCGQKLPDASDKARAIQDYKNTHGSEDN